MEKVYPFKCKAVGKIFRDLIKNPKFQLREPKRPERPGDEGKPNLDE